MPTGASRDDEVLRAGLTRWLAAPPESVPGVVAGTELQLVSLSRADGGMSNETLLLDLGADHPGVVLRLPPLDAAFVDYELGPQAAVQNAAAAAGVPAPAPATVVDELDWIGSPFLVMPWVEGRIPGPAPLFDQWLSALDAESQAAISNGLIDTLASLHAIDWRAAGLESALPVRSLADTVAFWADYVAWAGAGDPLPALMEALAWCRRNLPSDDGAGQVLLWGDARLGNLVFDGLRVHAVLDWDLASIGPREMDLGWYFGLEFMMEQLFHDRLVGFPTRDEALARYTDRSGHAVTHLDWHEVFALTRALAISDRHQRIAGAKRRGDNPMGEILLARAAAAEQSTGE